MYIGLNINMYVQDIWPCWTTVLNIQIGPCVFHDQRMTSRDALCADGLALLSKGCGFIKNCCAMVAVSMLFGS